MILRFTMACTRCTRVTALRVTLRGREAHFLAVEEGWVFDSKTEGGIVLFCPRCAAARGDELAGG